MRALVKVEQGEHADTALDHEILGIDRRERGLATEMVYGSLRRQGTIDHVLSSWLRRPLNKLTPWIRSILRLGAYQLLYLDRVPAHAAVNEAVQLSRKFGHTGTAGMVNAVLRRIADHPTTCSLPDDPVQRLAILTSHPQWLIARWLSRYGRDQTIKLCEWNNSPAPVVIRPNRLRVSSTELGAILTEQGVSWQRAGLLEDRFGGLVISGFDTIASLDSFSKGLFQVQDEGAMLASIAADPRPGWSVLDACAGYGGKTTHLAELMGNRGRIVAVDSSKRRLCELERACNRLGITIVSTRAGDARKLTDSDSECGDGYDLALIDAPCTGTGVLRRNPDARWKRSPDDVCRLAELGGEIAAAVSKLVKPGGVVVYVTCSLEPEENAGVIDRLLADRCDLAGDDIAPYLPAAVRCGPGQDRVQLLPHIHNADGLFICRLRREVQ